MSVSSLFGKPNLKAFEAPIRAIVTDVLREQGYASPAEVQAIRDDARDLRARLDTLEARLGEVSKLAEAARVAAAAVPAPVAAPVAAPVEAKPDPRVAVLEAQVAALRTELAGLHGDAVEVTRLRAELEEVRTTAGAPLVAAPKGNCKVDECAESVRSKGFCSAHYQQWRRGTLKGFVGLDGTVEVDGRVIAVGADHAGGTLKVEGNKLLVDGAVVVEVGLA